MKNLIEKIEKIIEDLKIEKQKCFEEIDYPLSQVDRLEGRILAYTDILMALNQYNIITAPKSIKLSEIVKRLKNSFDCYTTEIKIDKHEDATIIEINYYSYTQCECGGYIQIIDGTICDISFGNHSYHKWLYTLWIAKTEIVDDMECDE